MSSRSPSDPSGQGSSTAPPKKEGESPPDASKDSEKPIRPHKPLNRVPRACNACRRQKMRCEGADNPPCKRCRHSGIECLFEKPVRDTVTTEQGLERIRTLENQVTSMQSTLAELVSAIRGTHRGTPMLPSMQHSPTPPHTNMHISPHHSQYISAQSVSPALLPSPQSSVNSTGQSFSGSIRDPATGIVSVEREMGIPVDRPPGTRPSRSQSISGGVPHLQGPPGQSPQFPPYPSQNQPPQQGNGHHPQMMMAPPTALPPFSTLQGHQPYPPQHPGPYPMPGPRPPTMQQLPPFRQKSNSSGSFSSPLQAPFPGPPPPSFPSPSSPTILTNPHSHHHGRGDRNQPTSSNVTSADSSDDEGELPTSGLVAPLAVLRTLADTAENERVSDGTTDGSAGRTRSHSPETRDKNDRPMKRRKTHHKAAHVFPDVVTKGILDEKEARDLFAIYYRGCSTFLPVFDAPVDTFDALRTRSPFCVDAICMVAAKVRDGGGPPSEVYKKCLDEVQKISCVSLFSPVSRMEAVQAMILVAGWSDDGGWLSLGHAIRMAFEIGLNKAWPKLLRRITSRKTGTSPDERELVIATRTWFCLYLFEHQLSLGTGRPAILRGDETVDNPRMLLQHPLTTDDDMRLVSMVEMMLIQERTHDQLSAIETLQPMEVYQILSAANQEFEKWFYRWDETFSQKFEDATFYRQSLQIQRDLCLLWHFAGALRGIKGPEDVAKMPHEQREIAIHSIQFAQAGLGVCLRSPSYREGLQYAVHFTHASATFAASLLIRLARLFPRDCDVVSIMSNVEDLATLLSEVPAGRYAKTLRLMLQTARRRRVLPPRTMSEPTPPNNSTPVPVDMSHHRSSPHGHQVISQGVHVPVAPLQQGQSVLPMIPGNIAFSYSQDGIEQFAPGFELGPGQEPPVWLSETNLGEAFSQYSFETFFIPPQFDDQRIVPQIW